MTGHFVMLEMNLKTANMACSKMRLLHMICRAPSQDLGIFCVLSNPARSFRFLYMYKKQSGESHSCEETWIISLDASLRIHYLPTLQFLEVVFGHICSSCRGNRRLEQNDSHSNSHSNAENCAFWEHRSSSGIYSPPDLI